ncbi:hypothetical protein J2T56_001697 [Natronobacillus azotifigens]|uniref:Uncharacterized protein n=1 Tax=Natronobacillus azotifigens TaxID=472978 RepID=A0A9J6RCI8_9BACI|nr:hypothetical protein [Natronobacillus azotifigens]MCZ0703426.1 hypothetical protein [Natronobacillus azotifigens]
MDWLTDWGPLILIIIVAIFVLRTVVSFAMKVLTSIVFLALAGFAVYYFIL